MPQTAVAARPAAAPTQIPLHDATATLRSRWPSNASRDLNSAFDFTLGAMTAPKQEADRLKKEGKLSQSGIAEKVREHASTFVGRLRMVESLVEIGRTSLKVSGERLQAPESTMTLQGFHSARKCANICGP